MRRVLLLSLLSGCVVDQNMGQRCASDDTLCFELHTKHAQDEANDASTQPSDAVINAASCPCDAGRTGTWNGRECEGCIDPPTLGNRCVTGTFYIDSLISYSSSASSVCGILPLDPVLYPATLKLQLFERARQGEVSQVSGCMVALPAANGDPGIGWRASLSGYMDCATGELVGKVRSTYNVVTLCTLALLPAGRFFGKGTMEGTYDPDLRAFLDGSIGFLEPKTLSGKWLGGSGTWSGMLDGGVEGAPIEQDDCLMVKFPEDMFLEAGI